MAKWADYLISEVVYDLNRLVYRARRHQDTENGVDAGSIVDRLTIASGIRKGHSYMTIYNSSTSWKRGHTIRVFRINGQPYIRIDNNKVKLDFLGSIPELQGYESELKQLELERKSADLKDVQEPAPKPEPPSQRDLPKEPAPKPEPPSQRDLPKEPAPSSNNDKLVQAVQAISPVNTTSLPKQITAYCVKCKETHQIDNPQNTVLQNGRSAVKGICSLCGCKVFKFIKTRSAKQ